jgi:hypothetical protein
MDEDDEDEDSHLCDNVSTIDLGKTVQNPGSESSRQSSESRTQSSGSSTFMGRPAPQFLTSPPWISPGMQRPPPYSLGDIGSRDHNSVPGSQSFPNQIGSNHAPDPPAAGFHWPSLPQSHQRRASVAGPSDHIHSERRGRTTEPKSLSDGSRNQKEAAPLQERPRGTSERGQMYDGSFHSQQGGFSSLRDHQHLGRTGAARTKRSRSSTVSDASAIASTRKGKTATTTRRTDAPSDSSSTSVDRSLKDKGKGKATS